MVWGRAQDHDQKILLLKFLVSIAKKNILEVNCVFKHA
jgi:hypothetical protein